MPHVAFLHERFLFRFGHDRTMLLHGRELVRRGWRVSFVALRADAEVIARIGAELVILPLDAVPYADLDVHTAAWVHGRWRDMFADGLPDVVIVGGWPFHSSISTLASAGAPCVAFDAGVTPLEGLSEADLPVHEALRRLRREHLPRARATVSVSRFIAETQTLLDAPSVPNTVVLNAVDHLDHPLWTDPGRWAATLRRRGSRRSILHLGRWEGGYKNKAGALEVLRRVLAAGIDAELVVLATDDPALTSTLDEDLVSRLVFVGAPDDVGLRRLMQECGVGLSASLWEGFNLPLAEMHYLGRPAFALDIGAHEEAALDRRFLCDGIDALAMKIVDVLTLGTASLEGDADLLAYRHRMRWKRATAELATVLDAVVTRARRETPAQALVLDITNASRDPANSGVVRVTRRLGAALQPLQRCLFVVWDEAKAGYRTPTRDEARLLSRFGGPRVTVDEMTETASLPAALAALGLSLNEASFLCAETLLQPRAAEVTSWLVSERIGYAAVLHDLIPLQRPDLCSAEIVAAFGPYLAFLEGARTLIANSATTAAAWRAFGAPEVGPALAIEPLAGDFGLRGAPAASGAQSPIRILTVSTLEPRKNHATLLEAFTLAHAEAPDLDLRLELVGNGYAGDEAVAQRIGAAAAANSAITVHGVVDDARLRALYEAAAFTVYPSLIEGFGLPILESVWRARAFICGGDGATAEAAAGGGGVVCDVTHAEPLARAIVGLARDASRRHALAQVAALRQVRTWRDYAKACAAHALAGREAAVCCPPSEEAQTMRRSPPTGSDWEGLLYPGKPGGKWQMTDSERMGLAGLLARWRPRTYLEIGTYWGGSALLAAEFADWVITIDIDVEAQHRFDKPENVTFFAGRSQEIVPGLLDDLAARELYPDFVLIDGEHTADGVRRDVDVFLSRKPPRPLLIVFHDSFNPGCRAGIGAAAWADCPWLQRLDLDFVPGRMVEGAGDRFAGELWGGLAVALLTPEPRTRLDLQATSELAFRRALAASATAAP